MKKRKIYEIIRMMLASVLVFAMTTTSFAATVPFTQISDEENLAIIEQRNYFKKGDVVEIFGPSIEPFTFTIPDIYDEEGNILEVANHPEQIIKFKIPKKVYQYDIMRIKL